MKKNQWTPNSEIFSFFSKKRDSDDVIFKVTWAAGKTLISRQSRFPLDFADAFSTIFF